MRCGFGHAKEIWCIKQIMVERGYKQAVLVTSAFHMERSMLNFRKAGADVQAYPADYMVNGKIGVYFNKFTPSAGGLQNSCVFFREWLGILVAR